jgi:ATP-dependent DNA helicase recG-like protein
VLGLWGGHVEGISALPGRQNEWRQAAADFTQPPVLSGAAGRDSSSWRTSGSTARCRSAHDGAGSHLPARATRRALASTGRFERIGLVPRDAWLEGLVNAVIHRSYSISGDHIRIEIFDDRIEVESPGRFPGISDMSPLKVTRFARNPRVARVCADLNFGQELGEGIRRIFEEMRLAGLAAPVYRQTSGSVRLVLNSAPIDVELESRLPRGARDLVHFVREAGRISTR